MARVNTRMERNIYRPENGEELKDARKKERWGKQKEEGEAEDSGVPTKKKK